jgi:glutaredoxin 3
MREVIIYTAVPCGYCSAAKSFFKSRKIPFKEIDLTGDRAARLQLMDRTGQRTVPQIFVGDVHVGGYTDLRALDQRGGLTPLLEEAGPA